MKLRVRCPSDYVTERRWVVTALLGADCEVASERREDWCVELADGNGSVTMPDAFFMKARGQWLSPSSIPTLPLAIWNLNGVLPVNRLASADIPVLFGSTGLKISGSEAHLGLDIFGSAFFLMSRYEELAIPDRDQHGRFPAALALAVRAGIVERPLADEYIEILHVALERVFPGLQIPRRGARKIVSCDVDNPYERYVTSTSMLLRRLGGDLLKRRSLKDLLQTTVNSLASQAGVHRFDPLNTFDWIMDHNEVAGNMVEFYFLVASTDEKWDSYYSMAEPRMRALLRRIHSRGHIIGLHGSYGSSANPARLEAELRHMRAILDAEGIVQNQLGVRQHYLRWDPMNTPRALASTGASYDSTLAFAECIGFRAGTCRPFPLLDFASGEPTTIEERPLAVMESTLLTDVYSQRQENDDASTLIRHIEDVTRRVGGDFGLLWHNDSLILPEQQEVYLDIISR